MARNTFATFGILAVLLFSFGMVSAIASVQNVTLEVMEKGVTGDRLIGANESSNIFTVNFTNNNESLGTVYVNWTVGAETNMLLAQPIITPFGENNISEDFDLKMPYKESSYVRLTAHIYDNSDKSIKHGTKYVNIYYNNTDYVAPVVLLEEGCTDSNANNTNTTEVVENNNMCTYEAVIPFMCEETENPASLAIKIEDIKTEEGFGDDDGFWYPLDEVELEIEIDNKGNDVEDIEIYFCLYDVNEEDCILDEDDVDLSEDDFDLDGSKDETIFITFQVDPSELSESSNYEIRVSATGTIDDSDSLFDENESCVEESEDIEIRTSEKFVVLNDIRFESLSGAFAEDKFLAGSQVKISGEAWNIGNKDLDDDEVYLEIYSSLLGIDEIIEFDSGIDYLDMEFFETIVTIPADLQEKEYRIDFTVYDDERIASKYIYENKEEDTAEYSEFISVQAKDQAPTIKATLGSSTEVGKDLVIKTTITNNGDLNNFIIAATGFESWAELVSITPTTLEIASGNTQELIIVLSPTKAGVNTFEVVASVGGETYNQTVIISILEKQYPLGLNGTTFYLAIAVASLLILILLVLITRVARRPVPANF